ncbi:uncharacterized protein METZ01_LOCUS296093 [marine metagenome]|uniref:Uncharacterized protein n=1 Tax=marine metagenome TaxID=408172 RepID=A0A382M2S7_9ZZZZ
MWPVAAVDDLFSQEGAIPGSFGIDGDRGARAYQVSERGTTGWVRGHTDPSCAERADAACIVGQGEGGKVLGSGARVFWEEARAAVGNDGPGG